MKATKAKEIEKKFDENEDISKYLDLSKARRPEQEQKRVNALFNFATDPDMIESIIYRQKSIEAELRYLRKIYKEKSK